MFGNRPHLFGKRFLCDTNKMLLWCYPCVHPLIYRQNIQCNPLYLIYPLRSNTYPHRTPCRTFRLCRLGIDQLDSRGTQKHHHTDPNHKGRIKSTLGCSWFPSCILHIPSLCFETLCPVNRRRIHWHQQQHWLGPVGNQHISPKHLHRLPLNRYRLGTQDKLKLMQHALFRNTSRFCNLDKFFVPAIPRTFQPHSARIRFWMFHRSITQPRKQCNWTPRPAPGTCLVIGVIMEGKEDIEAKRSI